MDLELLEKQIGFYLPREQISDIPFQAAFSPGNQELQERSKFFVDWGHSIIRAAYAVYLYLTEPNLPFDMLLAQTKKIVPFVESKIYKENKLKRFVIKSPGISGNYQEISSKIIVLIYSGHGFLSVYKYLFSYFFQNKLPVLPPETAFTETIEKYADQWKLKAVYKTTIKKGGMCICRITVGNQFAESIAKTEKEAKRLAQQKFLYAYCCYSSKIKQQQNQFAQLNKQRKEQIIEAIYTLGLQESYLTFTDMDIVFTHPSYKNMGQNKANITNAVLSHMGYLIWDMLIFDYSYGRAQFSADIKKKQIPENNITHCLSNYYAVFLLKSQFEITEDTRNRMKIEVFRGILASLIENAVFKHDEKILNYAKNYAFRIMTFSDPKYRYNYNIFTIELAKIYGLSFSSRSMPNITNSDNSISYNKTVTLSCTAWEETGTGVGESEITAFNNASRDVLGKLLHHCDKKSDTAAIIQSMLGSQNQQKPEEDPDSIKTKGTETRKPHTPLEQKPVPDNTTIEKPSQTGKKNEPPKSISFDKSQNVLYICKGTTACERKKHKIISVTGILVSLKEKPVKINVNHCPSCNMYFISQDTYKDYREKLGAMMGNFVFRENGPSKGNGSGEWADQSILNLCGYTVDQKSHLLKEQRWIILKNIMVRDIIPKYRIENYLEFFIRLNKNVKNKESAIRKWKEDLEWVRSFNIDQQRQVWLSIIKKAN